MPAHRSVRLVRTRRKTTRARRRLLVQRTGIIAALVALSGVVLGLAFAGSPATIAPGVRVAGVDVGGMTPRAAKALLEQRADALASAPVTFRAGNRTWQLEPRLLGVRTDWGAAVDAARKQGEGFGPFRGFRRLDVRVFGADVAPPTQVYAGALKVELDRIAGEVDTPRREAAIVLRGLAPVIVPGKIGDALDRHAAAATIVRALASLTREPVELPVRMDTPKTRPGDLTVVAAEVKTALSSPVRLTLGSTAWRLVPRRIATLLELPADGRRDLRIGGAGATAWFAKLQRRVNRAPVNADWAITSKRIGVVPDQPGYALDVAGSAQSLLRATLVTEPQFRSARLVADTVRADRTAAEARAMHIVGLVSSYETFYGGVPTRIHNVQLVSHLIDDQVIAPGATFSFNQATGARTAEKGFQIAPVIINGELKTGLGGGVCQVSTTVFNAAYEAGLPITARTNHALYISHYPQGRDATVNYPDVDLEFVNDTGRSLLLRTWVGSASLTVALYGTPVHRRVVSDVGPLVVTGRAPVQRIPDPSLAAGEKIVQDSGAPARSTSVRRRVYAADGRLLDDTTFYSSYRAEPATVLVGAEPKPKPKRRSKGKKGPATTTTTTTAKTPQP